MLFAPPPSLPPPALCQVARAAIAAALRGEVHVGQPLPEPWHTPRPVFVTLRDGCGALRGCIGHLEPAFTSLVDEVAACAHAAAFRDPRFAALTHPELCELSIEVSILGEPEPVADPGQLDPARYGVVVSAHGRRGVLLPAVAGVDSVREQLRIACSKAGIGPESSYTIERFEVLKVRETDRMP